MRTWTPVLIAAAALTLAAVGPASAQHATKYVRCCFDVEVHATFELDNTWNDPPSTFSGPTSHGFLVNWLGEGVYEYVESHGKGTLKPVAVRPRVAAYLYDHDAGAATGTCLRSLTTSGDIVHWQQHWLAAHGPLVQMQGARITVAAGAPFQAHLAVCGGTFPEDVHSNAAAAKFGLQGPWSYTGAAPTTTHMRTTRREFTQKVYVRNTFVMEHGTPPHETDGRSNCFLLITVFRGAALKHHVASFNRRFPLSSKGFVPA